MDNLYQICQQLNFQPKLCLEAGAAHVTTSQLREFVKNGVECILLEASPRLYYCLMEGYNNDNGKNFMDIWPSHPNPPFDNPGWKNLSHVKIHNVAVFGHKGKVKFFEANASSFVEGVNSPAVVNDNFPSNTKVAEFSVDCDTIDVFDNGKIDLLAADVEGSEFYCLENLISRPKLIALETHGQRYTNPRLSDIDAWMQKNNYSILTQTESDTLFIKN